MPRTLLVIVVRAIAVDRHNRAARRPTAVRSRELGLTEAIEGKVPHRPTLAVIVGRTNEAEKDVISTEIYL